MSADTMWKFENRWMIEGLLTTNAPLHIGNGDTIERPLKEDKNSANKEIIPGSTIKGNLRSWMDGRFDAALLERIFGTKKVEKDKDVKGGRAEFHCAYMGQAPSAYNSSQYDAESVTDISIGIAIDRRTRSVSDGKLFQQLVVPPGTEFFFRITGQNMGEEEVVALLKGLEGFNNNNKPLTLGSGTAGGWGRLECKLQKVGFVGKNEALAWLNSGAQTAGYCIPGKDRTDEFRKLVSGSAALLKHDDHTLNLEIELHFDGLFLVNDPVRIIREGTDKTPDLMPRITKNGKALLPASSFRGAFRSQAERIARTVGKDACRVDDTASRCKPIFSAREKQKLCIACRTFGAAGWKTPLFISDFIQINDTQTLDQEFVAIDRFTGGGRDGAKFNARGFVDPVLKGSISIDTSRIGQAEAGLLALVLRDLIEGDITFGFGSAKGYGSCMAKVVSADLPRADAVFHSVGVTEISWKTGENYEPLREAATRFVQTFCEVTR
jgi:CRISPR/Cas system CSM-associated protein Csm3 (group 7 of RAMP superfamily)